MGRPKKSRPSNAAESISFRRAEISALEAKRERVAGDLDRRISTLTEELRLEIAAVERAISEARQPALFAEPSPAAPRPWRPTEDHLRVLRRLALASDAAPARDIAAERRLVTSLRKLGFVAETGRWLTPAGMDLVAEHAPAPPEAAVP